MWEVKVRAVFRTQQMAYYESGYVTENVKGVRVNRAGWGHVSEP